jgi:hypothetical protein
MSQDIANLPALPVYQPNPNRNYSKERLRAERTSSLAEVDAAEFDNRGPLNARCTSEL